MPSLVSPSAFFLLHMIDWQHHLLVISKNQKMNAAGSWRTLLFTCNVRLYGLYLTNEPFQCLSIVGCRSLRQRSSGEGLRG
mgnify:FL=1